MTTLCAMFCFVFWVMAVVGVICFLVCGVLLFCIGNDCAFCTVSVLPVLGVLLFCV